MDIKTVKDGASLTIFLSGRLDTSTAPGFQKAVEDNCAGGISELTVDLKGLDYVSSAGLRVFLMARKLSGKMTVKNVCETIMEVFDITGFSDIFDIE